MDWNELFKEEDLFLSKRSVRPKKRNVRLDGYDLGDGVSLHQSPVTVHQGQLDAGGVVPGGGDGSEQEGPVTPKIKKGAKEVCN